jgi:hypothetical protein
MHYHTIIIIYRYFITCKKDFQTNIMCIEIIRQYIILGLHNGANSNPTYGVYAKSVNSIILGQKTISRKSNTGGATSADPYTLTKPGPLVTIKTHNIRV